MLLLLAACGRDGYECKTVAENVYECVDGDKTVYYDESGHAVKFDESEESDHPASYGS